MRYVASSGERHVTIELGENGQRRHVTLDDTSFEVDWQAVGGAVLRAAPGAAEGHYSLLIGERSFDCYVRSVPRDDARSRGEQLFEVEIAGQTYFISLQDERTRTLAGLAASHDHGDAPITAPMPGLVSNIMAEVGQQVERGQTVIVLEAMKMENDLGAPRAGVVRAIKVARGQTVNQAEVLAIIGDVEGASTAPGDEDEANGA
jgi:biotin carboxyl carrier protein